MIPPGGIDASVWGGLIGTGVAFVLPCVLTFFAGLPRASAAPGAVTVAPALGKRYSGADERQRYRPSSRCRIAPSPAACWVKVSPLSRRWAEVIAPFPGEVASLFQTKHAIGLQKRQRH